jgi:hypothetical protein
MLQHRKDEDIYPLIQMVMGYPEFCSDRMAYENLIAEKDEEASVLTLDVK